MKTLLLPFVAFILICSTARSQQFFWATRVLSFSSEFNYDKYPTQYRANEVLGYPSCEINSGTNAAAWSTAYENSGKEEYIEVTFGKPMQIQQVLVHENFNAGAITSISLRGEDSELRTVYRNDSVYFVAEKGRAFQVFFPRTSYKVETVRITLNCEAVKGYQQIDAIGIADHQLKVTSFINLLNTTELSGEKEKLSDVVNSPTDELSPNITPDGSALYFTRQNHPGNFGVTTQDIWRSDIREGEFQPAVNLGQPLNNDQNSSVLGITPDGNTMLILNVYNPDGTLSNGISISKKNESGWGFPKKVEIEDFHNDSKYAEYCLLNSGNVLLMTVQRKEGYGNKDIYVSFLKEDGTWSKPKNLGNTINTVGSEVSPFMAADNRTLYYATSSRPGYGNADIFMSRRIGDGWDNWTEPVNLGPTINSEGFDAYYTLPASGEYAYFSSFSGSKDGNIYRIKLPKELRPLPVIMVEGRVLNSKTNEPIGTDVNYFSLSGGVKEGSATSDPKTGEYKIVLPAGQQYGFSAFKEGFLPVSISEDLRKLDKYTVVKRDLYLTPIEEGARIRINNLYFDFDKSDLRKESNVELDQLAEILKKNKTLKVRIEGHTDDKGDNAYNLNLSSNRSKSVKQYLVLKGIEAARLESVGFGETKPLVPNTSDANRQQNRRVEIVVTGL